MRILLILLMLCSQAWGQEVVTKLDVVGQGIINEELRRTRSSTSANGASIVALQAELASKFPVTIANGGTGQTTASTAINALLPDQGSANGKYLTSNGSEASWGDANKSITYTTPGTFSWTAPDGVYIVRVSMVAGGAQGGAQASGASGGGSGAWIENISMNVIPGNSYTVVVGSGGAGVAGQGGNDGTLSSFQGSEFTLTVNPATDNNGGASTSARSFLPGPGHIASTAGTTATGSAGAGTPFGKGGAVGSASMGSPGTGYGSGGGAGAAGYGYGGGAGAGGMVHLEW